MFLVTIRYLMHLEKKTIRRRRLSSRSVTVYTSNDVRIHFNDVRSYLKARSSVGGTEYIKHNGNSYIINRADGPAIEYSDGSRLVWLNEGKKHRIDGPAVIFKNHKEWFISGVRH